LVLIFETNKIKSAKKRVFGHFLASVEKQKQQKLLEPSSWG